MSDFGRVLVAALGLLILATVLFTVFDGSPSGNFEFAPSGTDFDKSRDTSLVTTASSFFLGTPQTADFVTKNLRQGSFEVSYLAGTEEYASGSIKVSNGIFYGSDRKAYSFSLDDSTISNLVEPVVRGTVRATNGYGNLVITFNGRAVYSERHGGGESFAATIDPSYFENNNTLVIGTTSSSWRTWAPSVYQLDFTLSAGIKGNDTQSYLFTASSSDLPANNGRLTFKPLNLDGSGNMVATVNGNIVFNGTPNMQKTNIVDFEGSLINSGVNTVTLGADGNAVYMLESLNALYFFDVRSTNPVVREFALDRADMEDLPGRIRFSVTNVVGDPSSIEITILDRTGFRTKRLAITDIRQKEYIINIDEDDVSRGRNSAEFRLVGNGGVQIRDFRVEA